MHNQNYDGKLPMMSPNDPRYVAPDPMKRIELDPNKPKECGIPDYLGFREKRIDDPAVIAENSKKLKK